MSATLKTSAPAAVETVAVVKIDKALASFNASAVTASKAMIDMIVRGSLVFMIGHHLADDKHKSMKLSHWHDTMSAMLKDANPGKAESTLSAYVSTARKLYDKLVRDHSFGGPVADIRTAKSIDAAADIVVGYLRRESGEHKAAANLDGLKTFVGIAGSNDTVKIKKEAESLIASHKDKAHAEAVSRVDSEQDPEIKGYWAKVAAKVKDMQTAPTAEAQVKTFVDAFKDKVGDDKSRTEEVTKAVVSQLPPAAAVAMAEASIDRITKITDAEAMALQAITRYYEIAGLDKAETLLKRAATICEAKEKNKKVPKGTPPAAVVAKVNTRKAVAAKH